MFSAEGPAKGTTYPQNVERPAGLAEKDAAGDLSSLIDGIAGRVDYRDIRTRGPKLLGDVPTGRTASQLNIRDDGIDPFLSLQVPESLACIARFQNFIAGASQRLDKVQARQSLVFHDENRDY